MTFGLIPVSHTSVRTYRATLTNDAGVVISDHTATLKCRMVFQLWLIFASPLSLVSLKDVHADRKMVNALLEVVERDLRTEMIGSQGPDERAR